MDGGGMHWRVLRRLDWSSGQDQPDHHSHPYEVVKTLRPAVGSYRGSSWAFAIKCLHKLSRLHEVPWQRMMGA